MSSFLNFNKGNGIVKLKINNIPLKPGKYLVTIYLASFTNVIDHIENAFKLVIVENKNLNYNIYPNKSQGNIMTKYIWEMV